MENFYRPDALPTVSKHWRQHLCLLLYNNIVCVSCFFRYKERVVIEPHPEPKKFENFELSGKIFCRVCHWNWGVMGVYKKVPFPIINIEGFVVINPDRRRDKYKRWKEVPFDVEPIRPDDLVKMRPADDDNDNDEGSEFWQ